MTSPLPSHEVLHRQVHPSFVVAERLSSQAFEPSENDKGKLSVDRSSIWTAAESFEHYTKILGLESCGVWGVSVSECLEVGTVPLPDSCPPEQPDNLAHALIDFTGLPSKNSWKKTAKKLAELARKRQRVHPP